jgi:hypothetical protein
MTSEARGHLLSALGQAQEHTAPVKIEIGAVRNHQVKHDCVRITDAPSSVIETVFAWVRTANEAYTEYIQAFMEDGALVVK